MSYEQIAEECGFESKSAIAYLVARMVSRYTDRAKQSGFCTLRNSTEQPPMTSAQADGYPGVEIGKVQLPERRRSKK